MESFSGFENRKNIALMKIRIFWIIKAAPPQSLITFCWNQCAMPSHIAAQIPAKATIKEKKHPNTCFGRNTFTG